MKILLLLFLWLTAILPTWADVDKGIVLNFNTDNPEPVISTVSGVPVSAGIEFNNYCMTGNDGGEGYLWYVADDWHGSPIQWEYCSPLFTANNPAQSASVRKFTIFAHGSQQSFLARCYSLSTLANGSTWFVPQDGQRLYSDSRSVTDITTWNTGATSNTQTQMIDMSSKGTGRMWQLRLFGSAAGDHIDLIGVQSIQPVGGLKQ